MLAYFVGQVANTIPVPGAASGGLVGVLLAFGVDADLALGSVLAYRAVAIWLPAPIGLVALSGLRRTMAPLGARGQAAAPRPRSSRGRAGPLEVVRPLPRRRAAVLVPRRRPVRRAADRARASCRPRPSRSRPSAVAAAFGP